MVPTSTQTSLSLTGKQWLLAESDVSGTELIARLFQDRGVDPQEGQTSFEQRLPAPALLPDIEKATERIHRAVVEKETIGLFGDYDCDGITAVAQLIRFFQRHGIEPVVRLPHRVRDGYGLSTQIIDECREQKCTLLITADTGITAVEEIAYASDQDIDVIVTDHHQPHEEVPAACALVHPQLEPRYPRPHPSGAGVVFQVLRTLEEGSWEGKEVDCALAAIGTVADLVPLHGGNRALVQWGIECLATVQDGPLKDVLTSSKATQNTLSATDIAFRIAPRLNAAGRISEPDIALRALLGDSKALEQLSALNSHRQDLTQDLTNQALALFDPHNPPPFLFAAGQHYHPGIVGLIAGKLTETFGRPSLVATVDGVVCTASLRSIPGYSVVDVLTRHQSLLTHFGGHSQAAGCTFPTRHLHQLQEALEKDVADLVPDDQLVPTLSIDATLTPADVTELLCAQLAKLEPYGQGNPEPRFGMTHITLDDARTVGADDSHLQCRVGGIKAIGFRLGHLLDHTNRPLDLVCRVGMDVWNGRREPQLFIEDLRENDQ